MKKTFRLVGLDCANCAAKMERKIAALDGVKEVVVNFLTTKLILELDGDNHETILENVLKAVKSVDPDVEMKRA